ncbi:MAG: O-antigen ligase family protein [Flavobacteriaceae bacterium]
MRTTINYSSYQTFVLWLLIVSGPLKSMFTYFYLDFNFTLFAFILAAVDIVVGMVFRRYEIVLTRESMFSLLMLFFIFVIMVISLLYTDSGLYAYEKSAIFIVNILYFIYPLFITKIDLEKLCKWLLWFFLPVAIMFVLARFLYFSELNADKTLIRYEFYLIRKHYLGLSTTTAALILLLVYLKKPFIYTIIALTTLIGLGGRGAFLFLIFTLFIWKFDKIINFGSSFKLTRKHLTYSIFSASAIVFVIYYFFDKIFAVINFGLLRFKTLLDPSVDRSTRGRIERLEYTIDSILAAPWKFIFGEGIGSFGILYTGVDGREYPHNIYLEVLFELGLLGLIPFLFFTIIPFWYKRNAFFQAFMLYFFLNALKSGDLTSIWTLFLSYGFIVFNPKIKT